MSGLKVWKQFTVNRKDDGKPLKLRIQDAPEAMFEKVIDFLVKYFMPKENFHKAAGIWKSQKAIEEYMKLGHIVFSKCHIVICVSEDDPDKILGVSSMSIETEDENDLEQIMSLVKEQETLNLLTIVKVTKNFYDARKFLGIDQYYSGRGISVHPDYQGLGIGTEFVKTRRMITREHGVPATGAMMTSMGTQRPAEKDGWRIIAQIPFQELGALCGVVFNDYPPICKYMVAEEPI